MKLLFTLVMAICPFLGMTQVEHNFEMNPENTDCHKLPQAYESPEQAIEKVTASKFRFQQSVKLSRFRSPRSVIFYSCDGIKGYLIANETDDERVIYPDIPKTAWDQFINSEDPIYFYANKIKGVYKTIE